MAGNSGNLLDPDKVPTNIKKDVDIDGVLGSYDPVPTAISASAVNLTGNANAISVGGLFDSSDTDEKLTMKAVCDDATYIYGVGLEVEGDGSARAEFMRLHITRVEKSTGLITYFDSDRYTGATKPSFSAGVQAINFDGTTINAYIQDGVAGDYFGISFTVGTQVFSATATTTASNTRKSTNNLGVLTNISPDSNQLGVVTTRTYVNFGASAPAGTVASNSLVYSGFTYVLNLLFYMRNTAGNVTNVGMYFITKT